jgi:hypothetical protein
MIGMLAHWLEQRYWLLGTATLVIGLIGLSDPAPEPSTLTRVLSTSVEHAPSGSPPHDTPGLERSATPSARFVQPGLSFEPNQGQTEASVLFLARGRGHTLFVTDNALVSVLPAPSTPRASSPADRHAAPTGPRPTPDDRAAAPLPPQVVQLGFVGANAQPRFVGLDPLPGVSHYFIGNDPERWHTNVPHYARLRAEGLYEGIDLTLYEPRENGHATGRLEYDLILAPGADPAAIRLSVKGAESAEIDAEGHLRLKLANGGELIQRAPRVYQRLDGHERAIPASYVRLESSPQDIQVALAEPGQDSLPETLVGFQIAAYDRTQPLVIDPVIEYSTYFGGSEDENGSPHWFDDAGNVYLSGETSSNDLPTSNAFQADFGGDQDLFVAKVSPNGQLLYSTYFGGDGYESGDINWRDGSGNLQLLGETSSTNLPTLNAVQTNFGGDQDLFIAKLSPDGQLLYSTYFGGDGYESDNLSWSDDAGNFHLSGETSSTNLPTLNAFQANFGGGQDLFIAKLSSEGRLIYSTYFGGSGDESGDISSDLYWYNDSTDLYLQGTTSSTDLPVLNAFQPNFGGGTDLFVARVSPEGRLIYSSYFGGSGYESGDLFWLDDSGDLYLSGTTSSSDLRTLNAFQPNSGGGDDLFIAKLSPEGQLRYSTYFGGSEDESGRIHELDSAGNLFLFGTTSSRDLPTLNALQAQFGGGSDLFIAKLSSEGQLRYSTYFGGDGDESSDFYRFDDAGNLYLSGSTSSSNIPILNAFQPNFGGGLDIFVAKLNSDGQLLYSSYFGGDGSESSYPQFDSAGNLYLSGSTSSTNLPTRNALQSTFGGGKESYFINDLFIAKLNPDGQLIYSTYFGGDGYESGYIRFDGSNNLYLLGSTSSSNLPILNAFQPNFGGGESSVFGDLFIAKLNPDGQLLYSTYFGGSGDEYGYFQQMDDSGNIYLSGHTSSSDLPILDAVQAHYGGNDSESNPGYMGDCFLAKFSPDQQLIYSTYVGGSGNEYCYLIRRSASQLYLYGWTTSSDFPTLNAFQPHHGGGTGTGDIFIVKLSEQASSTPSLNVTLKGSGRVVSRDGALDCPGVCQAFYPDPTPITLTATPADGWQFAGWGGACTGTGDCTLTITSPTSVIANFNSLNNRYQLDSPVNGSFESGIGVVHGWVCEAEQVSVRVDDRAPFATAYGAERTDSAAVCGDTANGFAAAINWSDYGDGEHTLSLLADGQPLTEVRVTVTTLDSPFLTGRSATTTVSDFPAAGLSTLLAWSEPHQNFVVSDGTPATQAAAASASSTNSGNWESPLAGGVESGQALIRGWACAAGTIRAELDGTSLTLPYGSEREDTRGLCGDTDNGYALAINWADYRDGPHQMRLLLDGAPIETRAFQIATPGGQGTVSGVQRQQAVSDFPNPGDQLTLQWSEPHQNFRIIAYSRRHRSHAAVLPPQGARLLLRRARTRTGHRRTRRLEPRPARQQRQCLEAHGRRTPASSQ